MTCNHVDFRAVVEISRLFHGVEIDEAEALERQPDSLAIDLRAECVECGTPVRFEGPIGIAVGPGAKPTVSLDGLELRAAGHLGENNTPPLTVSGPYRVDL